MAMQIKYITRPGAWHSDQPIQPRRCVHPARQLLYCQTLCMYSQGAHTVVQNLPQQKDTLLNRVLRQWVVEYSYK